MTREEMIDYFITNMYFGHGVYRVPTLTYDNGEAKFGEDITCNKAFLEKQTDEWLADCIKLFKLKHSIQ